MIQNLLNNFNLFIDLSQLVLVTAPLIWLILEFTSLTKHTVKEQGIIISFLLF